MNGIVLLTALSVGQPGDTSPPVVLPTVPVVQPMPPAQPPMGGMQPMPVPPMGETPMTGNGKNGNGNGDEEKKDKEEKNDEPPPPEPYALMRLLSTTRFGQRLNDRGITVDGWLEGNYTASTAPRSNLPMTFNDRADFWQFNQNYLRVYKTVDPTKDEFQLGFRTEYILPGTDARFSIARGFLDNQLKPANPDGSLPNYYPIDVFQLYGEAFLPNVGPKGTTVKLGRFATHVGYELVQGAETPFITRSYLFQYNPFSHTGVWATTQLNDTWTVSSGLSLGSDNFIGTTARLTYLGQLKWAPKEGKSSVLLNAVVTAPRYDDEDAFPYYNVYNVVFTRTLSEKLTYVADATFSHINAAPLPNGTTGAATWYGAAQYLIYKHTDKVVSTFRTELFEDTKGFRTGYKGLYTEVTYGLAYSPTRSVILRPTVRYDHNNDSTPWAGAQNLFTAAMDVIIRY